MKFTTILGSGNKAGIEVPEEVISALGEGKRIIEVLDGLAAALAAEPVAQAFYATLNYSTQRRYVEPIGAI